MFEMRSHFISIKKPRITGVVFYILFLIQYNIHHNPSIQSSTGANPFCSVLIRYVDSIFITVYTNSDTNVITFTQLSILSF